MNNEEKILQMLEHLTEDVSGLKQDVSGLKEDVAGLKQDVSVLKEDVAGLKQDVSVLKEDVSGLKQDVSVLRKDVDTLKEDVSDMRGTLTRVAVTQETLVLPRLNLLAEGHTHLVETLAPKKEVDELKSDMSFMKIMIESLSDRVTRLEKAQ